MIFIYHYYINL